ncbi:SCP2 sterol-binding domain-containing protein [Dyella sp. EPa41]|uniref:ubiquinone anaerobic biosynthesis accessory factor UbiT n=1 Tax=Dyella sp. EPa41 TaxID=1561194 RepID=UPI00191694F5|nr:SCP2 sterol-binding domain-containing protein [Dyella sp. EPa41]
MSPLPRDRWLLDRTRGAIDGVDDGLILLLATRRRLVRLVAWLKARAGVAGRDAGREQRVHTRAQTLAARVGVPGATARALVGLAIDDACLQQGIVGEGRGLDVDQGRARGQGPMIPGMPISLAPSTLAPHVLRWMPPPRRVAPLVRAMPGRWLHALLEKAMARVLAVPLRDGSLDFMQGRRLGIEVSDLGLRWVLTRDDGRFRVMADEPEASVSGSATDLLLLAGRLEDADTLFFQRRLVLTGDTELGLTARNLLERLPWEDVPLGLRIALHRGARLARMAREAHRERSA